MIDKESIVLTRVNLAVKEVDSKAIVIGDEPSSTPSTFPCIVIEQTDNPMTDTDLENRENAVDSTFQATVYMNGSNAKSTSKRIEKSIDSAMNGMGFQRRYGWSKIENLMNASISRRVATYRRTICDGDTI